MVILLWCQGRYSNRGSLLNRIVVNCINLCSCTYPLAFIILVALWITVYFVTLLYSVTTHFAVITEQLSSILNRMVVTRFASISCVEAWSITHVQVLVTYIVTRIVESLWIVEVLIDASSLLRSCTTSIKGSSIATHLRHSRQ